MPILGYTSLLLAAAGYDVTSTDLPILTEGILGSNIASNKKHLDAIVSSGDVQCLSLDWTSPAADWAPALRADNYDLIISSDSS